MNRREVVETARLLLPSATAEELFAFAGGDRDEFERLLGASAPDPLVAPPETGDVLDYFRTAIEEDPNIRPWFFRWIIERTENRLIGSVGLAGYPNDEGAVLLGYSIYPEYEGRGYASEAATGMVGWALGQERVNCVQATIFPSHTASQRVAAIAGMRYLREVETDDGLLGLWSVSKSGAPLPE
jgi:[ribosomal protein S5]-alanine N-acetyltransferase